MASEPYCAEAPSRRISSDLIAMDGIDALTFTGGVGENAPSIRTRTAERLSFLGLSEK